MLWYIAVTAAGCPATPVLQESSTAPFAKGTGSSMQSCTICPAKNQSTKEEENSNRVSLHIRRAEARERIFRQMKQDPSRSGYAVATRGNFVKHDGKDSVKISCDEFLEVPNSYPTESFHETAPFFRVFQW